MHFSSFQHKTGFHIPQKYLTNIMGQICFSLLTESFDTQILFFEGIVAFFFFSLLNKKQIVWELFMAHFVCFQQMENDYKWYCFLMIYSGYSQMTGLNKSISIIFCCQQPKALISWSPLSSKKPFSAYFSLLPFPDYQNNLLHVFYFHKLFSTFLGMGMRMKWANTEKKE